MKIVGTKAEAEENGDQVYREGGGYVDLRVAEAGYKDG